MQILDVAKFQVLTKTKMHTNRQVRIPIHRFAAQIHEYADKRLRFSGAFQRICSFFFVAIFETNEVQWKTNDWDGRSTKVFHYIETMRQILVENGWVRQAEFLFKDF